MKHKGIYVIAFLLALLSGLGLNQLYYSSAVSFKVVGVGSAGMCDGGIGSFSLMRTEDGKTVSFSRIRFPSERSASECFETMLQRDVDVFDFGRLYDESLEKYVGRRVHTRERGPEDNWTILSVEGDQIYAVSSTSLKHALIFEHYTRVPLRVPTIPIPSTDR